MSSTRTKGGGTVGFDPLAYDGPDRALSSAELWFCIVPSASSSRLDSCTSDVFSACASSCSNVMWGLTLVSWFAGPWAALVMAPWSGVGMALIKFEGPGGRCSLFSLVSVIIGFGLGWSCIRASHGGDRRPRATRSPRRGGIGGRRKGLEAGRGGGLILG